MNHVVELANTQVSLGSPVLPCGHDHTHISGLRKNFGRSRSPRNSGNCRFYPEQVKYYGQINSLNRRATLAILRVNRTELVFSRPLFHR